MADRQATPDICLYRRAPLNMLHDEFPASAPPLLAIEIVSSSQTLYELIRKAEAYFAAGVSSCWIVQPLIETVTVLHPNEKPRTVVEGTVEDPTLGISVRLEEIFRVNAQCGTCVKISP